MNDGVETMRTFPLIGVAGHQQDGQRGMVAGSSQRQRNAVHNRHADVGQQQIEPSLLSLDDIERFAAVDVVVTSWPSIVSARAHSARSASSSSAMSMRAMGS